MLNTQTTLVAVFDDAASAATARLELINEGFTESEVQVTSGDGAALRTGDAASGNTGLTGTPGTESSGGGIGGWFRSIFGGDSDESGNYAQAIQGGGTAVTVTDDARADRAVDILNRYGAIDIDERAQSYRQRNVSSGAPSRLTEADAVAGQDTATLPVLEEQLQVGKRTVRRGGVRVVSLIPRFRSRSN